MIRGFARGRMSLGHDRRTGRSPVFGGPRARHLLPVWPPELTINATGTRKSAWIAAGRLIPQEVSMSSSLEDDPIAVPGDHRPTGSDGAKLKAGAMDGFKECHPSRGTGAVCFLRVGLLEEDDI